MLTDDPVDGGNNRHYTLGRRKPAPGPLLDGLRGDPDSLGERGLGSGLLDGSFDCGHGAHNTSKTLEKQALLACGDASAACSLRGMDTVGSRIDSLLTLRGMNGADLQRELERRGVELTPQAVSNWIRNVNGISAKNAEIVADILESTAAWIMFGRSRPVGATGLTGPSSDAPPAAVENVTPISGEPGVTGSQIPLISRVAAGAWTEAFDPYAPGAAERWVSSGVPVGPNAFALQVRGDSMEPRFPEGCIITVDPAVRFRSGSFVVARHPDWDHATFKQYIVDGDVRYLRALNANYRPMTLSPGTVICGVVVHMHMNVEY